MDQTPRQKVWATMTRRPPRQPRQSREMRAFLDDARSVVQSLEWLVHHAADLEQMGHSREATPDRASTGRRKVEGSPRLDLEGWPNARRVWRKVRRQMGRTAVMLDSLKAQVQELSAAPPADATLGGSDLGDGDVDGSRAELQELLKRQRARRARGEYVPVAIEAQPDIATKGTT